MNEKMVQTLEAALHRVLCTALCKVDSMYPHRDQVTMEYLMHRDCVALIRAWFEQQVGGIRRLRFSLCSTIERSPVRPHEDDEFYDDWDVLLDFFGLPSGGWIMTVSLSALPSDIRQLLEKMTHVIEVAFNSGIQQCLDDLKILRHSLADNPHNEEALENIAFIQNESTELKISKAFLKR